MKAPPAGPNLPDLKITCCSSDKRSNAQVSEIRDHPVRGHAEDRRLGTENDGTVLMTNGYPAGSVGSFIVAWQRLIR
jgi:hypothetical protein